MDYWVEQSLLTTSESEIKVVAEQAKRDEFARDMAGAGIKQNILTNAALTENMQRAGLNMGLTAAQQAGNALTARYNY